MSSTCTMSDVSPHDIVAREDHYKQNRSTSPVVKQRVNSEDLSGVGAHFPLPLGSGTYSDTADITDDEGTSQMTKMMLRQPTTSLASHFDEDSSSYARLPMTRGYTPLKDGPFLPLDECNEYMRQRCVIQEYMNKQGPLHSVSPRRFLLIETPDEDSPPQSLHSDSMTLEDEAYEHSHCTIPFFTPRHTPPQTPGSVCTNESDSQDPGEGPLPPHPWSPYHPTSDQPDGRNK